MPWNTPIEWTVNQLITANDLNEQIKQNMEYLKSPPTANYILDESSDYTTGSTTFVDVDATNLALTIETAGGDVLVHFHGVVKRAASGATDASFLVADENDVAYMDEDGLILPDEGYTAAAGLESGVVGLTHYGSVCFTRLITGLTAGSHTFKLQWRVHVGGRTVTLYAGAGSVINIHPQFWVREIS